MSIVDDLVGDGGAFPDPDGADPPRRRGRNHRGGVERMQRPDVGAIVDFVRRYRVAIAVAREENDLAPAYRPEDHGPGRLAVRRAHHLPAHDLQVRDLVERAAADDA